MSKNQKIDPLMRRAMIAPDSLDEQNRTVDVVFATDTPVRTYSWSLGGAFDEILSCDPSHIRKARLDSGLPVLDNHNSWSGTKSVYGVADNYTLERNQGKAKLRFAKAEDDPEADKVFRKIKDGILRGISIGYRVFKYEEMNPNRTKDEIPQYRAIDWEPYEISIAPIPADVNSKIRNENTEDQNDVEIISTRSIDPEPETPEPEQTTENNRTMSKPNPETVQTVDTEAVRKLAIEAERKRSKDILDAVRKAKLDDNFAQDLIEKGTSIDEARAAIIEKFATEDPNKGQRSTVAVGSDETDKRRNAQIDALVLRAMPEVKLGEGQEGKDRVSAARNFRGMTLLEIAKDSLVRSGVNIEGLDKMEIAKRAITSSTSDFPVLLEGTNRRVLLANYQAVADTWRRFCTTGNVGDFREYKRLRMGSFSNLEVVGENQEFKNKNIPDAEFEKISAQTKGNIINVSRQMIVNDDLSAFTRLAGMLGRAAARSIEADVYALLALNSGLGPLMADGKTLFHADHKNIATGAAMSVSAIDAMRVMMAQQMDPDNNDFLDIRPEIMLCPIGLGSTARILNTSQYDPDAVNKLQRPNVVNGLFADVIDTPRLTGTAYYMLASSSEEPVIEVAFLDGNQSPYLESQETFKVDGMQWKVRMDYGVGAVGWRGAVRNAGQ